MNSRFSTKVASAGILTWLLFAHSYVLATNDELTIWQSGADYVVLAPIEKGAKQNDHPISLEAGEVQALLQSLQIAPEEEKGFFGIGSSSGDPGKEKVNPKDIAPLFNAQELQELGPPIAKALASASPNQDILFSITGQHDSFLGKNSQTTAARLFHHGGFMHIILGDTQVDLMQRYRRRGGHSDRVSAADKMKLRHFRLKAGSREELTGTPRRLVPVSFQVLKNQQGKVRTDWILTELSDFRAYLADQKEQQQSRTLLLKEGGTVIEEIDQKQEALTRKMDALERKLEHSSAPDRPKSSQSDNTRKQRLRELQQLYKEGLIPKDIYQEKLRSILEEI